jgi:hypothetical protein
MRIAGDARIDGSRSEKHQPEVPQSMQQKNWEHDGARIESAKLWHQIKLGRYRKDDRAKHQIDG